MWEMAWMLLVREDKMGRDVFGVELAAGGRALGACVWSAKCGVRRRWCRARAERRCRGEAGEASLERVRSWRDPEWRDMEGAKQRRARGESYARQFGPPFFNKCSPHSSDTCARLGATASG
mmetsp:Transcript_6332/g.16896  ORF Transcript_6332/g.16896 Transcript_6332/m.16896 type:complete len:121 (+) Transcript_6332:47-409(+)